jgi:hypothetical protein
MIRPILFSTQMVKAILAGTKKQTRRAVKMPSAFDRVTAVGFSSFTPDNMVSVRGWDRGSQYFESFIKNPYGECGDRLWVRETFAPHPDGGYVYRATDPHWETTENWRWKPSIHMPYIASRLELIIEAIRIERLQDITHADAKSEGVRYSEAFGGYVTDDEGRNFHHSDPVQSFCKLWSSINGPESWDANPWVWVITFKKLVCYANP